MKIPNENVSAFSVYSEKLKQKKKSKPPSLNGVHKMKNKQSQDNKLTFLQTKEISDIMQLLSKQSIKGQGKKKSNEKIISQLKENNNFGKHNKNKDPVKSDENNKATSSKKKRKAKKKLKEEHAVNKGSTVNQNINSKNKKPVQLNRVKAANQEVEENFSNDEEDNRDTNEALKGPVKSNRKRKLEQKISQNTLLIKEKQNSLKQKKNKTNLTNSDKMLKTKQDNNTMEPQTVSESKILSKDTVGEHSKFDKKTPKLSKKKQTALRNSDWTSQENSALGAKTVFESIINPIPEKDFMRNFWEKQLLLIQRKEHRNYFSEIVSTPEIDSMLRKNNVQFTKHLDVTSYTDKGRETHNLSGRAQANVVWDFYTNGCSVRLLNPQTFLPKIHTLNAALQGYFGCFVGANVYLTPPNSQGFAPHYDDIEAFVLQIEGKKQWKVYHPRSEREILPRVSSPNFTQEEIGEPILDVTLEPGDMLYFPRGFIHQASTVEGEHSLHVTLSAYQKTAWVDLLEKALPIALERAAVEDVEFRQGLPRDYLNIEFQGDEKAKMAFTKTAQRLMSKVANLLQFSLGAGVDKMGAQFMHDALPPVFTPEENQNLGEGLKMKENGKLIGGLEFDLETEIKLIRANICRLVDEDGELRLYHCLDNSLEYHGQDPQFLVLPPEGADVVTILSTNYPLFTKIKTFNHTDEDALLTLVSDLWDTGLLLVRNNPSVEDS